MNNTQPGLLAPKFRQELVSYLDRRLIVIFLLGTCSGFPWVMIGAAMTAWLTELGLSRASVGLFGLVFGVYAINFLWGPLVDHMRIPWLARLGQRRSWIVLCQLVLCGFTFALSLVSPEIDLTSTALLCLLVATASATQDLVIDAYRINVIRASEPELIGPAAAMATCGWWTGLSLPGAVVFWVVDAVGWHTVYLGLACCFVPAVLVVMLFVREPPVETQIPRESQLVNRGSFLQFFDRSYIASITEFFVRNGLKLALAMLAFIFLFKLGEAFLGRMVIRFYKEVGFTNAEIGTYSKLGGLLVTISCSILAGWAVGRIGVVRGLLISGVAMALTNLLFSWIAVSGPLLSLFALAVILDGATSAFTTVAFVSFISYFSSRVHAATQYGAMASLGNASRTLLAASSGFLVDGLDGNWALFFVLTALMVIPALLILLVLGHMLREPVPKNQQ